MSHTSLYTKQIMWPVLAALALNGFIFANGIAGKNEALSALSFAPPGWAIGTVWVVLFALMGCARASLLKIGTPQARNAAFLVTVQIIHSLLYPLYTGGFQLIPGFFGNYLALIISILVLVRVRGVSEDAAKWLVPNLLWVTFASFLGTAAVLNQAGHWPLF